MKKSILVLFLLIYTYNVISQNNDWSLSSISHLEGKRTKVDDNIRYFIDSEMNDSEGDSIIEITKKYIKHNAELITESNFKDSVYVVLVQSKDEMLEYVDVGDPISGICMPKDPYVPHNLVICIPKVLKHELMHMLVALNWNPLIEDYTQRPTWLSEGLAVYANPEAEDLNGLTLKEVYASYYQDNKLLDIDLLTYFPSITSPEINLAYIQSGYIVQYLIERYGIQKFKKSWIDGFDFKGIYGISLEEMILKINEDLYQKPIAP